MLWSLLLIRYLSVEIKYTSRPRREEVLLRLTMISREEKEVGEQQGISTTISPSMFIFYIKNTVKIGLKEHQLISTTISPSMFIFYIKNTVKIGLKEHQLISNTISPNMFIFYIKKTVQNWVKGTAVDISHYQKSVKIGLRGSSRGYPPPSHPTCSSSA
jgi:hypothetical protein